MSREQLQVLFERLAGDDQSISYDGQWEAADLVRGITEDVELDVLPHNPTQALAPAEQVIALDAPLMNWSCDDGVIGNALGEACTLWLKEAQVRARHARKTGFWRQVTVRSL